MGKLVGRERGWGRAQEDKARGVRSRPRFAEATGAGAGSLIVPSVPPSKEDKADGDHLTDKSVALTTKSFLHNP